MAATTETQGFFSSNGVLKNDSVSSTASKSSAASEPAAQNVTEQAAAITDEAVYTGTSRLNVGSSGFDSGVAETVNKAVTSALQKIGERSSSGGSNPVIPRFTGGTYQNEILRGKGGAPTTPSVPSNPPTTPSEPEQPSIPNEPPATPIEQPPRSGRGRGRGGRGNGGRGSRGGGGRGGNRRGSVDTEA